MGRGGDESVTDVDRMDSYFHTPNINMAVTVALPAQLSLMDSGERLLYVN
jgi:hypothetical protein